MDDIIDDLGLLTVCPHCQASYRRRDIHLIENSKIGKVYHLICPICTRAMIFSLQNYPQGIAAAGLFTDCNFSDAQRFINAQAVSADDVISVHSALKLDNFFNIM